MRIHLLALLVVAFVAFPALADKVVRKDGTEITGVIVSENATTVVIQVSRGGAIMRYPVERSAIASVKRTPIATRPATQPATRPTDTAPTTPPGPGYYPLPIIGEIGIDVTAATLREALGHARRVSPAVIVLVFDTEGGDLEQARQMLEVLRQQPEDLRIVAHVREALSSGAVVAMGCREIYMADGAVIGASSAEDATAKAAGRLAAEQREHPTVLAEGMFDPEVELVLQKDGDGGATQVLESGGAAQGSDVATLKPRGRLLTLSAAGAVECGLAQGTLDSLDDLQSALGMSEPLHKMANPAWYVIERKGKAARDELARQAFIAERKKAFDEYMEKVGPELEEIDARLEQIKPELRAAQDTLRNLDDQWNAETRAIEDEYRLASRIDARLTPERRARMLERAKVRREEKLTITRERFQPQVIENQEQINSLRREHQVLTRRRKEIVDGAPRVPK